jgi:hypothetical protein
VTQYDSWVRDISMLRTLGQSRMEDIATDLRASRSVVETLNLDIAAFGENNMRDEIVKAYETARGAIEEQLNAAYDGMSKSADGIVAIANHYAELEKRMAG